MLSYVPHVRFVHKFSVGVVHILRTLRDIFIWIIILGIGILVVRKYGDFFQKSPNFVPQIKLSCFHAKLFQRNQNQFLMEFLKIVKN